MTELEGVQYLTFLIRVLRVLTLLGVLNIKATLKKLIGKQEAEG